MTVLKWDQTGERRYETGVDHGVLYMPNGSGVYDNGVAWNGLTTVTESPSGAEATPQYADNQKYLNLVSAESFGGTIEALTYPDEWEQFDGQAVPQAGISIGQQPRKHFGLCYRSLVGNDIIGTDAGYKLHMVYNCLAAPSEKARATVNDTPAALAMSWAITTTPVEVPGYKPAATLTVDSTQVDADALATLEGFLYGTTGTDPSLPLPAAVLAIFEGTVVGVAPTAPTFASNVITIPTITGITYWINGEVATSTVTITVDTVVKATPDVGYYFTQPSVDEWLYHHS